jgi:hypothetical protein
LRIERLERIHFLVTRISRTKIRRLLFVGALACLRILLPSPTGFLRIVFPVLARIISPACTSGPPTLAAISAGKSGRIDDVERIAAYVTIQRELSSEETRRIFTNERAH